MTDLLVRVCEHRAAHYAVMNWHYSRSMPPPRRVMFGVWENNSYRGCVIFSRGASANIGKPYGLAQTQVCELTRIALRTHTHPVSQIVAECVRQLRASAPGLRLVMSYADPGHGHHGGIYQAMNWVYLGVTGGERSFVVNGVLRHSRSMGQRQFGSGRKTRQRAEYLREHIDRNAYAVQLPGKHRYALPLDKPMRRRVLPLAQRYPERAGEVSMPATRPASGGESRVQSPGPARSPAGS